MFRYLKTPDIISSLVSSKKLDWTHTFGTYCILIHQNYPATHLVPAKRDHVNRSLDVKALDQTIAQPKPPIMLPVFASYC